MKKDYQESAYSKKLRDPRWQKKRLEIMERDNWTCRSCKSTETTLNVHHIYYLPRKNPWEYDADALKTLCENCHKDETFILAPAKAVLNDAISALGFHANGFQDLAKAFKDKTTRDCIIMVMCAFDADMDMKELAHKLADFLREESNG